MNEQLNDKIRPQLESVSRELEMLKEEVCEICVWPYTEKDQDAMDERCNACPVMQRMDHLVLYVLGVGHSVGSTDNIVRVAGTLLGIENGTCERVQELYRVMKKEKSTNESDR